MSKKPLILVDGSSYLYRAYHALPSLATSSNQPTGAVYGVINMLRRLLAEYDPEQMAIIFDDKGKTFRDELFVDYKANRAAMPTELIQQIEPIHEVIHALGIPLLTIEGVEADDVIGTLALKATAAGLETIISTGDKDLAQLVNKHVTLINTMTNTELNPQTVEEKFGVPPKLIIDYLTLVGDTSDNIPGIPQVGPKTAVKWLKEYGSLKNIIDHCNKITGKVGENLRACLEQIPLTQQLVTIKCDVVLPMDLSELTRKPIDKKQLLELYKKFEFKSWLSELLAEQKEVNQEKYAHYEIITTEEALQTWIKKLHAAKQFVVDTETTSLNYMTAKLVGISFAINPGAAAYVPFGHDYAGAPEQLAAEVVLNALKPLLEDPALGKIGHHLKYDMEVLANHGISLKGIASDTMLESYVLDSAGVNHDMDSLALKYLGWRTITFEDVAGKGVKQKTFNLVDVKEAGVYAAEDADVTLQLHHALRPRIENEPELLRVLQDIELPLVPVLARMERQGVLIDPQKLVLQGKEMQKRLTELELAAYKAAGKEFNMNSPKQLQEILFQVLKLPVLQKTPTGQPSTADSVLQELALEFTLPQIVIEHRSLSKLISTYTNRLVEQINPETGRIHTSYHQAGTATGRLSSSEPNLQNIPIRTVEGRRIRQAFIAPPGYKIVSADYSQIELRLMAHISEDPTLLTAFSQDQDIHRVTAAEVWGVPLEQVTAEMRRGAKAINFGLIYGMSAFGLTRQLGIDRHAAQQYIDKYFARYPAVKAYMENTRRLAREQGYVKTLWGRRLYLPDIHSSQIPRQKAAERTAINAPLQGSAADIIKLAMLAIDRWLMTEKIAAKMVMQVHDELVFEVKETELKAITEGISQRMSQCASLRVPLKVSVGVGDNWDKASEH